MWQTNHKLVGTAVELSPDAIGQRIQGQELEVVAVALKNSEPAAFAVFDHNTGKTFPVPANTVSWGRRILREDVWEESELAGAVRRSLKHWSGQHDYPGKMWDGVEHLNMAIARLTKMAAVESAGWYRYPSSRSTNCDGKDWRILIPDADAATTVVNCHSLLHDGVWTLSTTVFDTQDIDKGRVSWISLQTWDPWLMSMALSLRTAQLLQNCGFRYEEAIKDMTRRVKLVGPARKLVEAARKQVAAAYRKIHGEEAPMEEEYTILINDWNLKPDTIGAFKHAKNGRVAELTISPRAFEDVDYLNTVIKHELVHDALSENNGRSHGKDFQQLAAAVGIPKEYRD